MRDLVDQIEQCLPQTQCGECGYQGCRPYADAIINNSEQIDKCPPGGLSTLRQLAQLTAQDPKPFEASVNANTRKPQIATIREAHCIGCTKCIQACPVDAIIGTGKKMHSVIAAECTGCELCVPVCPTDCIDLTPIESYHFDKEKAKARFNARNARIAKLASAATGRYQDKKEIEKQSKQSYIQAALARVQAKQQQKKQYDTI